MFGQYDRKLFLSPRQERARPTPASDFRCLYQGGRVGLVSPPAASTPVKLQLHKLPVWGGLRRASTELRMSLPSRHDIDVAREQIVFYAHRRGYTRQQGNPFYLTRACTDLQLTQGMPHSLVFPTETSATFEKDKSNEQEKVEEEFTRLGQRGTIMGADHSATNGTAAKCKQSSRVDNVIIDVNSQRHPVSVRSSSPKWHDASTDVKSQRQPVNVRSFTPKFHDSSSTEHRRRNVSAKSTNSSKSIELPKLKLADAESVAARSERICQLRAHQIPEIVFDVNGEVVSGLYRSTFKQIPGAIENDRRNEVFLGGTDWKKRQARPIIYSNLFLPRVTKFPKSIGVRFRTDIDLVHAGKVVLS